MAAAGAARPAAAAAPVKVVLLRHGESVWNADNRFTGWADVDLAETGVEEAKNCGKVGHRLADIFYFI